MNNYKYTPCPQVLYVKPSFTVICNDPDYRQKSYNIKSAENLKDNKTKGIISCKAHKKIGNAIDWMLVLAKEKFIGKYKYKMSMITLTLPCEQLHDDNFIKKYLLNQFLTTMRKCYGLKHYVWRAEKQKNGNIHFHIIIDIYIHYSDLNKIWNKILDNHGYIDKYRQNRNSFFSNGFKVSMQQLKSGRSIQAQIKAYKAGIASNWSSPTASTDIHSLRKISNVRAYVTKYMSKTGNQGLSEDDAEYVNGRLWFISTGLSKIQSVKVNITDEIRNELEQIVNGKDVYFMDYATVITKSIKDYFNNGYNHIHNAIMSKVDELRGIVYDVLSLFSDPPPVQYVSVKV